MQNNSLSFGNLFTSQLRFEHLKSLRSPVGVFNVGVFNHFTIFMRGFPNPKLIFF